MIVKRIFIVFLTLQLVYIKANAQFFTIYADSAKSEKVSNEESADLSMNTQGAVSSDSVLSEKDSLIVADREKELFPSSQRV